MMYGWDAAAYAFKSAFSDWSEGGFADHALFAVMSVSNFLVPAALLTLAISGGAKRIPRYGPWILLALTLNSARFIGQDGIHIGYYAWLGAQAGCTALAIFARRSPRRTTELSGVTN